MFTERDRTLCLFLVAIATTYIASIWWFRKILLLISIDNPTMTSNCKDNCDLFRFFLFLLWIVCKNKYLICAAFNGWRWWRNRSYIIIKVCWQQRFPWISLTTSPNESLFLVSHLESIKCLYIDECKILLVGQHWCVHALESIGKYCLWVCPYFSSSVQHVLLVLIEWFLRWAVSGPIAAVLSGAASRICYIFGSLYLCLTLCVCEPSILASYPFS